MNKSEQGQRQHPHAGKCRGQVHSIVQVHSPSLPGSLPRPTFRQSVSRLFRQSVSKFQVLTRHQVVVPRLRVFALSSSQHHGKLGFLESTSSTSRCATFADGLRLLRRRTSAATVMQLLGATTHTSAESCAVLPICFGLNKASILIHENSWSLKGTKLRMILRFLRLVRLRSRSLDQPTTVQCCRACSVSPQSLGMFSEIALFIHTRQGQYPTSPDHLHGIAAEELQ